MIRWETMALGRGMSEARRVWNRLPRSKPDHDCLIMADLANRQSSRLAFSEGDQPNALFGRGLRSGGAQSSLFNGLLEWTRQRQQKGQSASGGT